MTASLGFPDWLSLAFFLFFMLVAWLRPIRWRPRLTATALGLAGLALLMVVDAADLYRVVLPPAYLCYATLPFVCTQPPRALEHSEQTYSEIRKLNLFVIQAVTHQANTFPSGHAAVAVAVALYVTPLNPIAGIVFLFAALSIMVGAFYGRYHYAADVALGGIAGAVSFMAARGLWRYTEHL